MISAGAGPLSSPPDFRVGEWLLEPSLDRLSRNGTVVHLRPQLTNLLVLLAQNAGRTVSKEEILARVWEGQFVAESGMTRCIAEIRQALGDDARDPKVLQTITKRGYRLVAPVTVIKTAPLLESVEVAEQVPPGAREPPGTVPRGVGPASAGVGTMSEAPPGERRTLRRLMSSRGGPWALASIAAVASVAVLAWTATRWDRPPVLSQRDTVLLADVINTTGDTAFDHTLRLALAVHLGQAPFLRILPSGRMRAGLSMMGRSPDQAVTGPLALELCRREGAAVLLAGSIARVGSHYVVGLEAQACSSGESVDRQLIEVESKDDVLGALGMAAVRLRRTLGESRESLTRYDVPIVEGTTPSLEALKAVSLGDIARDHARLPEALMHYRRATELDPGFAAAWARRGAAAQTVGQLFGDDRSAETDEIQLSFRTAHEFSERVSEAERFYILGHYYRFVAADPEKAIETYRLWGRTYPGSSIPATNTGSIYANTLGRYAEALGDAREAVRLAPSSSIASGVLVAALRGTNKREDARQALSDAARRGVADLAWHRLAFEAAFSDSDVAGMAEQVRWASSDPSAAMALAEARAMAAASHGRLGEARRLWADASATAASVATASLRAGILLRQAEAEALLGDARAAGAAADVALTLDGQVLTRLAAAEVFALARDTGRAARLLDSVLRSGEPADLITSVWTPVVRALVEAGAGRADRALQLLGPIARFERGRHFAFVPLGVRAAISRAAKRPGDAVAAYRDLESLRLVLPLSPWVACGQLGLAGALREAGDVEASRAAYDAVLDWMKGADEDAPILIAARRERAALK
jgi:eukaryotic-like serine/threonine-protein kinase